MRPSGLFQRTCLICEHCCGNEAPEHHIRPREATILRLIAEGLTNKAIARELGLSEGTVKVYAARIYSKIGIANHMKARFAALKFWEQHPELHEPTRRAEAKREQQAA